MSQACSLVLALGFALFAAGAEAVSFTPLAQERAVEARTRASDTLNPCGEPGLPPCSETASASASAPDFAPFDVALTPTCTSLPCPPVSASQSSTIGPAGIHVAGTLEGEAYSGHEGTQSGSSWGSTSLRVTFRIDETLDFTVSTSTLFDQVFNDVGQYYVDWTLSSQPSGLRVAGAGCPDFDCPATVAGTLPAGVYLFELAALSDGPPPFFSDGRYHHETSFTVDLVLVPEPTTGLLLLQGLLAAGLAARY